MTFAFNMHANLAIIGVNLTFRLLQCYSCMQGEMENNKENRRGVVGEGNRERSGSRGRGGGARGRREEGGRGAPGRRGGSAATRLANGSAGGRGGRGGRSVRGGRGGAVAGAAAHYSDTFQPPPAAAFEDAIETWGEPTPLATDGVAALEEWGEEWTGSLETTNVFVPSQGGSIEPTPPPASDLTATDAAKLVNSSPMQHAYQLDDSPQQHTITTGSSHQPSYSAAANAAANSSLSSAVLMPPLPQQQQQSVVMNTAAMDLAALLQQAAPQSTLSGLGTSSLLNSNGSVATTNGGLGQLSAPSILGGISTNVGDVIKGSVAPSSSSYAPPAAVSSQYGSVQHNSIFSSGERSPFSLLPIFFDTCLLTIFFGHKMENFYC